MRAAWTSNGRGACGAAIALRLGPLPAIVLLLGALPAGAQDVAPVGSPRPAVRPSEAEAARVTSNSRLLPPTIVVGTGSVIANALPSDEIDLPRIRLELHLRAGTSRSVQKYGHEATSHKFSTGEDLRVPDGWNTFGWRAVIDVAVHRWVAISFHGTRMVQEAGHHAVHYRGVWLDDVNFGPGSRLRVTVDQQVYGGVARLLIRDDPSLRFSVGIGAAWARHRIVLRRGDLSASGSTDTVFLPTVSTFLSVRLAPLVSVFAESWTGFFGPFRFPSLLSDFVIGFRWHLTTNVELITALGITSGRIEDTDDLWGGKYGPRDRRERAEWTTETVDVGLAVTF